MSEIVRLTVHTLSSSRGQLYLAAHVKFAYIRKYVRELRTTLGGDIYRRYIRNLGARNGGTFHMTIVDPAEFAKLEHDKLEIHASEDVRFLGLGYSKAGDSRAYYVVAESEGFQALRRKLHLGHKDLHVTLGFNKSDVHGVRKNKDRLVSSLSAVNANIQ